MMLKQEFGERVLIAGFDSEGLNKETRGAPLVSNQGIGQQCSDVRSLWHAYPIYGKYIDIITKHSVQIDLKVLPIGNHFGKRQRIHHGVQSCRIKKHTLQFHLLSDIPLLFQAH